jgi:hypothetical protein
VQLGALALEGALPPLLLSAHFVVTSALLTAVVGGLALLVFEGAFESKAPAVQVEGAPGSL